MEELGDRRMLAHVADTEGQIELSRGEHARALERVNEALKLATETQNASAMAAALITHARALLAQTDTRGALSSYERAAAVLRTNGPPARLRDCLNEWAQLLAKSGFHELANQPYVEATKTTRRS